MEYRTLGKTGLRVSRLGCGGIPIQRIDAEGTRTLMHRLLAEGVNFVDTARGYTVSEEYLGYGNEIKRQMMAGAQPYYKTVLGDPAERQLPVCEESAQRDDETVCEEEKA